MLTVVQWFKLTIFSQWGRFESCSYHLSTIIFSIWVQRFWALFILSFTCLCLATISVALFVCFYVFFVVVRETCVIFIFWVFIMSNISFLFYEL